MLSGPDEKHLLQAIRGNACVLFLGAGFSSQATNVLGNTLPIGGVLARSLWLWLGYESKYGPYEDAPLDRLFDIAKKERGDATLLGFLRDHLTAVSIPKWYQRVAYPYWYRIYTTNVDDLIERIYKIAGTARLDVVNGVRERTRERDPYLERLQYVKLNGSVTESLDFLTFGARQYARRASEYGVWYDHFVRDYSTHTTILVGTKVNEPLFWQALEARQGRHGAARELRLRSFLVSDHISPVVLHSLDDFNVVPIQASSEDFFAFISDRIGDVPPREEVLLEVAPQLAQYTAFGAMSADDQDAARAFFRAFSRVTVGEVPTGHRSLFHHGATPDWEDLALGLDARREITAEAQAAFQSAMEETSTPRAFVVSGHRGAGKSTLWMRTALNIAATGRLAFFAVGEDLPDPHILSRTVDRMGKKVALFIDDAEWVVGRIDQYREALEKCTVPPVFICAVRSSSLHTILAKYDFREVWIGELTIPDIEAVIDVLTAANTLGVMTGRPRAAIREAFQSRARKQLLVAMKEVTTGRNFDDIIRREFHDIVDPELRITYTIACLATGAGASLTRTQLLSSSELPPAVLLSALERELNQILVRAPGAWRPRNRAPPGHRTYSR